MFLQLYRTVSELPETGIPSLAQTLDQIPARSWALEWCFYIEASDELNNDQLRVVAELLSGRFASQDLTDVSLLNHHDQVVEIGPHLHFETPWSSSTRDILVTSGVHGVTRIERALRIGFKGLDSAITQQQLHETVAPLYDRMLQTVYTEPLRGFQGGHAKQPPVVYDLLRSGMAELQRAKSELGLSYDEPTMEFVLDLFTKVERRNPNDAELFGVDIVTCEHARHPFFRSPLMVDGVELGLSLMDMIREPLRRNPANSLIAFDDDASAIRGSEVVDWIPVGPPGQPKMYVPVRRLMHSTCTAETHNHPTRIAPYPGAATGPGGRIRDNICPRCGGLVGAGGIGYFVGPLFKEGYDLPGEVVDFPTDGASPIEILVEASNGASKYGNCFGEAQIYGFTRSTGLWVAGEYRAPFKCVLYTVGLGKLDDRHNKVIEPQPGMEVWIVGGPGYRIGMGGGPASSMQAGEASEQLNFDSVQRGAPEMEQPMWRVVRALVEMGDNNPIQAMVDLGGGGAVNALLEIAGQAGIDVDLPSIPKGDLTLSELEELGNESQERVAFLAWPGAHDTIVAEAERENVTAVVVGVITDSGYFQVLNPKSPDDPVPAKLPLAPLTGKRELPTLELHRVIRTLDPLALPDLSFTTALLKLLRQVEIHSKGFLVHKVDRSVGGLIAQQQCVGPHQHPLADYAILADSLFGVSGTAASLGEQPDKGLISDVAGARMAGAEALLNMAGALIDGIASIKLSANWMWAAKAEGEGARLFDAAQAFCNLCIELGIAIDGGKDSLSMAVKLLQQVIKAPGEMVAAFYATMPDVRRKLTPDLKRPGNQLVLVDLSAGHARLGGSILAKAYGQLGNEVPDVEDPVMLRRMFECVQDIIRDGLAVSYHDRSDGGLVTTLLDMAFAGSLGIEVNVDSTHDSLATYFSEELGAVLECEPSQTEQVVELFNQTGARASIIGTITGEDRVTLQHNGQEVCGEPMTELRYHWMYGSAEIERIQGNEETARAELKVVPPLMGHPQWKCTYVRQPSVSRAYQPPIAIWRHQGSNGDREMAGSFIGAGFGKVYDVTTSDLLEGRFSLDDVRMVVGVGGFANGDVLGSAVGWAGAVRNHSGLRSQLERMLERPDTLSFWVCNGFQLATLLGIVPTGQILEQPPVRLSFNRSSKFESRSVTVQVGPSPAVMLRDMAGSVLGVDIDHGEGRAVGLDHPRMDLSPLRYVDPSTGEITEQYPFNPNGSPQGVAGLCSPDGRHLGMMPHTERRTNQSWQWPWSPPDWDMTISPWLKLYQNAYEWLAETEALDQTV